MATVLVVDDEPTVRELIGINLELDGHRVVVAGDGDEALRLTRLGGVELILLDLMMPGRDGLSVLRELKASGPRLAGIPVLVVTARGERVERIRAGIEGAIHYIAKPFCVMDLSTCVEAVLVGEPEPVQRRRALNEALIDLARSEVGIPGQSRLLPGMVTTGHQGTVVTAPARPRLTRLEPVAVGRAAPVPAILVLDRSLCTFRQNEVLDAVVDNATLSEAAKALEVSRTYLYASLRRIAHNCGEASGPELVRKLRSGELGLPR